MNERQTRQIRQATDNSEQAVTSHRPSDPLPKPHFSGDILNNTKTMLVTPGSSSMQAFFKTLSLRKIKRSERSEQLDVTVTEQKFAICFRVAVFLPGGELSFLVQELSLPVVVVVHGNQVPGAEATVLWDNAFARPGRAGFEVEPAVRWSDLTPHMRRFWMAGGLSDVNEEHLAFLAKLLGMKHNDDVLSWHQFSKSCLHGTTFTFWEWFYGCFDTTRKHLKALWDEGVVHGFIDKDSAYSLLAGSPPGTFLIRFSTSIVSGVSVSWVGGTQDGGVQVFHLQPWLNKDFSIRSLADRVSDLDQLRLLHPDRPKNAAFGHHYSSQARAQGTNLLTKGYVPADLKAYIDPTHVGNEPTYQARSDMQPSRQQNTPTPSSSAAAYVPTTMQDATCKPVPRLCVCACVRVCVFACVCACVRV